MEINVGDYVRDKNGRVGKVFDITNEPSVDVGIGIIPEVNAVWIDKDKINYLYQEEITKHSKDIVKLLEKGDILVDYNDNLYLVDYIDKTLVDYQIKKILTHEQFEANAYKIEKERCNCEIIYKTK